MVIGIGTDIIEVNRVLSACENEHFLTRNFTENEILLIKERKKRAAGNFAAKEAVSKVLGTGFRGFGLKDIEVLRDEKGKPYVNLYGKALAIATQAGIQQILVSISDTDTMASAFALGQGQVT